MADPLSTDLRSKVIRSICWRVSSQALIQGTRILVVVLLARLLTPREYGIAGMVLVFSAFVLPFADLGLGAALVQRRRLSRTDISTVFWTSLAAGVIFTIAGFAIAGPVAGFYGEPEVKPLFQVFSLGFLLSSLATVPRSFLVREINFRSLELRLVAGALVAAAVAVWAATAGYGPWALVAQYLVSTGVSTALYWAASSWRPQFAFSTTSLRDFGGFGLKVLGSRTLSDLRLTADSFLVGRFLGPTPLGLYTVAHNVVLLPFNRIVTPLQDVLFPAFSRVQDEAQRIRSSWLRVNRVLAAVCLPTTLGLIVIAPEFVSVVLGDRWSEATTIIQILGWVGLVQALQGLVPAILQSRNRPGVLLRFNLLSFLATVAAFFIGLRWGIIGVSASLAVVSTVMYPVAMWLAARSVDLPLLDLARSLAGVVQASVGMVAVLVATRMLLVGAGVPAGARFGILIPVGAAAFGLLALWRDSQLMLELRSLRADRTRAAAQGAT